MSVPTADPSRKPPTPTSVYKYYDAQNLLLYVGITSRGSTRQREHNSDKEWWSYVIRQEVEHYPSRAHAESREQGLIRKYCPPFNKRHNPWWEETREAYLNALAGRSPGALVATLDKKVKQGKRRLELEVLDFTDKLMHLRTLPEDRWIARSIDPHLRRSELIIQSAGRKMTLPHASHRDEGDLHLLLAVGRRTITRPLSADLKYRLEHSGPNSLKHISVYMLEEAGQR